MKNIEEEENSDDTYLSCHGLGGRAKHSIRIRRKRIALRNCESVVAAL